MARTSVGAIIASSDINGGPVKGVLQLVANQDLLGADLHLFNFRVREIQPDHPFLVKLRELSIPIRLLNQGRKNYVRALREARAAVGEMGLQLIQTHGFKPSFFGFCLKRLCRIPWICFMHGTTSENLKVRAYNTLDSLLQLGADRVVLVSESQRGKIPGGSNRRRVRVLHNAVDLDRPVKRGGGEIRKSLGLPPGASLLAVIGRLSPEKGVDIFIDAFASVAAARPECHAVIVGDGQERNRLEERASRHAAIAGRLHFLGYTPTPGDSMAESDIVVIPSRSEGIPNVALEAMALGKPVAAAAVGGVPEVIEDGRSGLLVPREDPRALAVAVLRLLGDPGEAARLSAAGRERIASHFSVKARCAGLAALYGEVLAGRR